MRNIRIKNVTKSFGSDVILDKLNLEIPSGKFFALFNKFAVANWVPAVVGITAGIAAAVAGFYIGQKYSTMNIVKKMAKKATHLLPKKIRKYL